MKYIGSEQYYTNLLYEESFIKFLNQVIATEKDPTHLQVAKELLFALKGNKIITYRPYYDGFYKKYKFTLKNVKSTDGFKLNVSSLDGHHQRFLGKMSSVTNPLPPPILPPLPLAPIVSNILGSSVVINPVNNVNVNPKAKSTPKSKTDLTLPNPYIGPIYGLPLATLTEFEKLKNNRKSISSFVEWSPINSKIRYTVASSAEFKSDLIGFFDTIYEFIYYRLLWIKPYKMTVFSGYEDKPYQGSDIKSEWDNFFQYEANKQKMNLYWNWSTPGNKKKYETITRGGDWWPREYYDPTSGSLKQKENPNSDILVYPEPCDQTVTFELNPVGLDVNYLPLTCVQNSFVDLLRRYLTVKAPMVTDSNYPGKYLYDLSKVPEWAIPDWKINNECARKVDYYEYKIRDEHKLVGSIRIQEEQDIESITIKDLPGLTSFTVINCPKLESIDLSGANNITTIYIDNCPKLTSVVGIGKTYLTSCTIIDTKITSLDFGYAIALDTLILYKNSINRLNLTGCNLLTVLRLDWNLLTSLDISSCTKLVNLSVVQNFLTELNVSNNNKLKSLDLSFNKLTETGIDNILQKFVEFTDADPNPDWITGKIYLHGGFNARPSYGNLVSTAGGMEYYIDLVDPYLDGYITLEDYDNGVSRLADELSAYIKVLYDDKVNYAVRRVDLPGTPYYNPAYLGPIKNWRRNTEYIEILSLYKKWDVRINRLNTPLIIFRSYEQ